MFLHDVQQGPALLRSDVGKLQTIVGFVGRVAVFYGPKTFHRRLEAQLSLIKIRIGRNDEGDRLGHPDQARFAHHTGSAQAEVGDRCRFGPLLTIGTTVRSL